MKLLILKEMFEIWLKKMADITAILDKISIILMKRILYAWWRKDMFDQTHAMQALDKDIHFETQPGPVAK